jgi:hypothetical protein
MARDFQFFIPVEFVKGADGRRVVKGFVTTEHKDREEETLLQDGLDFTEFMSYGWFNDNHSKATSGAVGWPTLLEKRVTSDGKKGHYVEGELLRDYGPANQIWELQDALIRNNAPRKLGFSVEGAIEQRTGHDGRTISKAKVRNVAITPNPINPYAGMETVTKALMAGADVASPGAVPGSGFALRPESLEGTSTNAAGPTTKKKRKKRKKMTAGEAVDHLMERGYSLELACRIVQLAKAI